jgi:hypothetical protein
MIPADIRIVECQPNFKIDFSSLLPTKTQPQIRTVENVCDLIRLLIQYILFCVS